MDLLRNVAKLVSRTKPRVWIILLSFCLMVPLVLFGYHGGAQRVKNMLAVSGDVEIIRILDDSAGPIIELEGVTMSDLFDGATNLSLDFVLAAVKARFNSTLASVNGTEYANCSIDHARYYTVAGSGHSIGSVGIAINLHNSEKILPAQGMAVLEAVSFLISNRNRVFISVYENDSSDKTGELLSDFVAAARALGVSGIFAQSSRMRLGDHHDRMVILSEIRNHAIHPLLPYLTPTSQGARELLIVINDVVTCAGDILELVHQQALQDADMVTASDWNIEDGKPRHYDLWVARGINGGLAYQWAENHGIYPLSPHDDFIKDMLNSQQLAIQERWAQSRPLPVYCTWGGMAAFRSSLFTQQHLRFRSSSYAGWAGGSASGALGDWGKLLSDSYLKSDCPGASECEYICRDIWNLKRGDARMVLASQARTTYTVSDWAELSPKIPLVRRAGKDEDGGDMIDWANVHIPKSVECIPSRDKQGEPIACWDAERYRIDPLWSEW